MKITNEVIDYISKNLDILKIIKISNQTKMNIPRGTKYSMYLDVSPNIFISRCNGEYKDRQHLTNLSNFIFLDTEKSIDCMKFLIVNSNGQCINSSISKHIYLDNFLKQYQASIVDYCIGTKDSAKLDIEKLQQEKKALATMMFDTYLLPSILLDRFIKMEKDIDNEINLSIDKIEKCVTILDKFDKMVSEVITSKEAWCGLLDLLNKK